MDDPELEDVAAERDIRPARRSANINVLKQDAKDMLRMGKRQELSRKLSTLSAIGFTSCVMGSWEILLISNCAVLMNGGLAGLFWTLVWTYIGQLFVVMSLAEMASMAPAAGGHYHWVSELACIEWQRFLSYCAGWLSAFAWQCTIAVYCDMGQYWEYIGDLADCRVMAGIVLGMVETADPTFISARWQATLITIANVIAVSTFNVYLARHLSVSEGIFVVCHIFLFIPVIVSFWVLVDDKQSSADVFLHFGDNGGHWTSIALSVMVGQVTCIFALLGSDGLAHMSEEVEGAGLMVAQGMFWSYLSNGPLIFILVLTYCFNLPAVWREINFDNALVSVFSRSFGHVEITLAYSAIMLALMLATTVSAMASTSRLLFAFARDRGLPYSRWLAKVNRRFEVPVHAILTTAMFSGCMSLINISSSVAFNAVVNLKNICLTATYLLSIGCVTFRRLAGRRIPEARWSLGRAGLPVNCLALIFSAWFFFWSFWPLDARISAQNFNWAGVLFAVLCTCCTSSYYFKARYVYDGPVVYTMK